MIKLEGLKERIKVLPITPSVLAHLRETARFFSTHYSTKIEGNRLSEKDVEGVLTKDRHVSGRERDEREVKGYFRALEEVERLAKKRTAVTEKQIQTIHAYVLSAGKGAVTSTPYRDGQNVVKDSLTGGIVYMPPEAKDVPVLMAGMVAWLNAMEGDVPAPIRAAIAHYQFATIHPYYDGNGRTARLLTTLVLHIGGYDLKGIYSLEEYYARNLQAYYDALTIGPSHNYYMGRDKADITDWLEYFINGMVDAFEKVQAQARAAADNGEGDASWILRQLDPRQRKALTIFARQELMTSTDLAKLFNFAPRTARALLGQWVKNGFLAVADPSKKARKYKLSKKFSGLF
ncbi:MAG: Fic family protein [Elusimicrobiales bacterium]